MEQFISFTFAKHLNPVAGQSDVINSGRRARRRVDLLMRCASTAVNSLHKLVGPLFWIRAEPVGLAPLGYEAVPKDRIQRYSGALAIINCKIITNVGQRDSGPDYAADKSTMIYAFRSPPPTPRLYLSDAPRRLGEIHTHLHLYSYSSLSYISINVFESTNSCNITHLHSPTVAYICWGFYFILPTTYDRLHRLSLF